MESLKKYNFLQKIFSINGRLIGIDVLDPDWRWGVSASMNIILCTLTFISYFYYLYKFREDFEFMCYSTIVIAPLIGVAYRVIYWPFKSTFARNLYEKSLEFCAIYSRQHNISANCGKIRDFV